MNTVNIADYGASTEAKNNASSIQKAIDAAAKIGGTVVVPAGVFQSGSLELKPHVGLHLAENAVLKGSPDLADYPDTGLVHNEMGPVRGLLHAKDAAGITIDGTGVIDYNGMGFFDFSRPNNQGFDYSHYSAEQLKQFAAHHDDRPTSMTFLQGCDDLVIRDVTLTNASNWDVVLTDCDNVKVVNITIKSTQRVPNDDGIHLCGCRQVQITGCNITTGDDCIAITGITDWVREERDIVIANCILSSSSSGIRLGGWRSKIKRVTISNCLIRDAGRGVVMSACHSGYVKDVTVDGLTFVGRPRAGAWWGGGEAFYLEAIPSDNEAMKDKPWDRGDRFPNIANIQLSHLNLRSNIGIIIVGAKQNITDVMIQDAEITMITSQNRGVLGDEIDLSPVPRKLTVPKGTCYWLYVEEAANVKVTGVRVHNELTTPLKQIDERQVNARNLQLEYTIV